MRRFVSCRTSVRSSCILIFLAVSVSAAHAQTKARVLRDQTIIWKPGFAVAAMTVKAGTILTVVSRMGDWYEVVIPSAEGAAGATGFISVSRVEVLPGSPPPPERKAPPRAVPSTRSAPPSPPPKVGIWGFGQIGYAVFSAHDSFEAVLNQGGGVFYGGGGEVRFRSFFVLASVEYFKNTGERAFVSGGKVYRLGIPDTISIVPVMGTAGWRFNRRPAIPYAGAGVGSYLFKESSSFSDASENVSQRFIGWHIVGGVEFVGEKWVATSFEIMYSHVPDALGVGGVSSAFGEHNLGGVELRVKLLLGR
jgi:opacity protein-like surface antigen